MIGTRGGTSHGYDKNCNTEAVSYVFLPPQVPSIYSAYEDLINTWGGRHGQKLMEILTIKVPYMRKKCATAYIERQLCYWSSRISSTQVTTCFFTLQHFRTGNRVQAVQVWYCTSKSKAGTNGTQPIPPVPQESWLWCDPFIPCGYHTFS
jgi:hypothetical protein